MVGGEPTILKEFPDLLKFVIKNKYSVSILSNGILYEKYIPKALKANENSVLSISIDCSTREKFKQIKKVDKFDEVIKNIKKYIKEAEDAIDRISIKFIILEGVNDSKEEIDNWINLCDSLGVKNLFITIEFCNSYGKKVEIKQETCDLYNYAKSKINENPNFKLSTYDFVEKMVECKSYQV